MVVSNIKHLKEYTKSQYAGLPVNATDEVPVYEDILCKTYRELTLISARYTRVIVVRLDLHPPEYADPYKVDLTKFSRSFTRTLATMFKSKVAYVWVRELDHNDRVHWHLWVAIRKDEDTQRYFQARKMQSLIKASWIKVAGGDNSRNHMSSWFYLQRNQFERNERLSEQLSISDGARGVIINFEALKDRVRNKNLVLGGVVDECFYALSYLAKVYTKVRTPKSSGDRIFASSNLNTKDKREGRKEVIESNLKWIHDELSHKIDPISLKEDSF